MYKVLIYLTFLTIDSKSQNKYKKNKKLIQKYRLKLIYWVINNDCNRRKKTEVNCDGFVYIMSISSSLHLILISICFGFYWSSKIILQIYILYTINIYHTSLIKILFIKDKTCEAAWILSARVFSIV